MEDFALVDNPWLEENVIRGHGPLGARYPKLAYIMEGDTPAFLGLIGNGLAWQESPAYGGWGGRYELRQSYGETRPIWTNSRDTVKTATAASTLRIRRRSGAGGEPFSTTSRRAWTGAYSRRRRRTTIRLCSERRLTKRPLEMEVKAGESVELRAEAKDPDGHRVALRWYPYPEAGTCAGSPQVSARRRRRG